jgi:hypothetical protein
VNARDAVLAYLFTPRKFEPPTPEQECRACLHLLFESIDPDDPGYGLMRVDAFLRLARIQDPDLELNHG